MRIPLKNALLAKLREFRTDMNVSDYLDKEHRQNIQALSSSYVDIGLQTVFLCSITAANIGVYPMNASNSAILADAGVLSDSVFNVSADGRYFVEFGFMADLPTGAGSYIPKVDLLVGGAVVNTLSALNTHTAGNPTYLHPKNGVFVDLTTKAGISFFATLGGATSLTNFYCKITAVS